MDAPQEFGDPTNQGSRAARKRPSLFAPLPKKGKGQRAQSKVVQLTVDSDVADALRLHCQFSRKRPGEVANEVLESYLRRHGKGRELVWGGGDLDAIAEERTAADASPQPRKNPPKTSGDAAA